MSIKRTTLAGLFAAALSLQGAWVVYTQSAKPPGPLRIEKVKGDLYMISGEGGNVAVYVTAEGVVLVDDMFDRNHADILAQVKSVTDKPLKYVINTHQHDDQGHAFAKIMKRDYGVRQNELCIHESSLRDIIPKHSYYALYSIIHE